MDGDDNFDRGVFSMMGASVAGRGDDMMVEMRSREAMVMFEGPQCHWLEPAKQSPLGGGSGAESSVASSQTTLPPASCP
jgi:hypothetical protein